ncbi:unnamed protein product [Lathyrus oleraceus]
MEPPQIQSVDASATAGDDDPQDKIINDCCSCCYDCSGGFFDYLCC